MKRTIVFVFFTLVFCSVSIRANAQVQITDSIGSTEFKSILSDVHIAVADMQQSSDDLKTLQVEIADFMQRMERHNISKPAPCPRENPGPCDAYNEEARRLRTEQERLMAREKALHEKFEYAKSHYMVVMGRLRIAGFLGCLREFRDDIGSCSNIGDPRLAETCLKNVWAQHC
jgi:hypothetical protein